MKNDLDYQHELISHQPTLPAQRLTLVDALGAVTAEPLFAIHPIPPFDNSAMDGYAVYLDDTDHASATSPVALPVSADIPAGRTTSVHVERGNAARIMTGAPMPTGADAIVQVELTDAGTETVQIVGPPGSFIRKAGADLRTGDEVFPTGTVLSARHLSAAASAGHSSLLVHPRPRVVVISTGSELRPPGESLEFGQIPNSNSTLICTTLAREAHVHDLGVVSDEPDALREVLDSIDADAIILTGGVSVGAYDVVKEVLAPNPGMWFGPVAMQPGKPQGYGNLRGMSVFTLPGNPVSVYVSLHMLVRPALATLAGRSEVLPTFSPAIAGEQWTCPPGRAQYIPVRIAKRESHGSETVVVPASSGGSGSHLIGTLARADGLVRVEAGTQQVTPGEVVQFWEEQ